MTLADSDFSRHARSLARSAPGCSRLVISLSDGKITCSFTTKEAAAFPSRGITAVPSGSQLIDCSPEELVLANAVFRANET
ncbi:MAG: hypothetical protein MZU97_09790 [Bacillus subtilis]|nr:hypothetical protein [Bacillus subtilis]